MPLYLKAECVFSFLLDENIFSDKQWKNQNAATSKYSVDFDVHDGNLKICSFEVSIINGVHCILAKQLLTIARKASIYDKVEKLFDDCSL